MLAITNPLQRQLYDEPECEDGHLDDNCHPMPGAGKWARRTNALFLNCITNKTCQTAVNSLFSTDFLVSLRLEFSSFLGKPSGSYDHSSHCEPVRADTCMDSRTKHRPAWSLLLSPHGILVSQCFAQRVCARRRAGAWGDGEERPLLLLHRVSRGKQHSALLF